MQLQMEDARREEEAARHRVQELEAQFIRDQLRREQQQRKHQRRKARKALEIQACFRRRSAADSYERVKQATKHLINATSAAHARRQYLSAVAGSKRLQAAALRRRAAVTHAQMRVAARNLCLRTSCALLRKRWAAVRHAKGTLSAAAASAACSGRFSSVVLAACRLQGFLQARSQQASFACMRDEFAALGVLQARARRLPRTLAYRSLVAAAHLARVLKRCLARRALVLDRGASLLRQLQVEQATRAAQAACRASLDRHLYLGLLRGAGARSVQAYLRRRLLRDGHVTALATRCFLAVMIKRRWYVCSHADGACLGYGYCMNSACLLSFSDDKQTRR